MSFLAVIASDKREAFAQGSVATKQSILSPSGEMDCFAALAMTRLCPESDNVQDGSTPSAPPATPSSTPL
jgi:hypothetical protein